jgi:hypothetical protein
MAAESARDRARSATNGRAYRTTDRAANCRAC